MYSVSSDDSASETTQHTLIMYTFQVPWWEVPTSTEWEPRGPPALSAPARLQAAVRVGVQAEQLQDLREERGCCGGGSGD